MTKKIILLMLCMVLLVGTISALDFDNVLSYEKDDMKVTIINAFNIPLLRSDLGTVELKSHTSVDEVLEFGYGKEEVVMYYDFEGWELYENGLGEVIFTNIHTNQNILKSYSFVEWTSKTRTKNIYKDVLIGTNLNGTLIYEKQITGTFEEEYMGWKELGNNNLLKGDRRIGLKTYVDKGDYIDAIWTIAGQEISKHAGWSAGLIVGLENFWMFGDDNSTLQVYDNVSYSNLSVISATYKSGLKDGYNTMYFDGANDYAHNSTLVNATAWTGLTFAGWVKSTYSSSAWEWIMGFGEDGANAQIYLIKKTTNELTWRVGDGASTNEITDTGFTDDTWFHVCATTEIGGNSILIVNGTSKGTPLAHNQWGNSNTDFNIATDKSHGEKGNINVTNLGLWSRALSLSECGDLFNGGVIPKYTNIFPSNPTITLDKPINHTNFTTTNQVVFNATIFDEVNIGNVTFFLNHVGNETNNTITNNTVYTFTKDLAQGTHTSIFQACDNENTCINSSIISIGIDTISPKTSISDPNATINFHLINTEINFNWTANDTNLDTCIYEYAGSNNTVTCHDNTTAFNVTDNSKRDLVFYVNDTFGHINVTNVTWQYRVFEYTPIFVENTTEGNIETFIGNVSIGASDSIISSILTYNATDKGVTSESFSSADYTYYNLSSIFEIITVNEDADVSFLWQLTLDSEAQINSTTRTQSVSNFGIDNCTANTNVLYNFTIVDEKTQTKLVENTQNTTAELNIQIFPLGETTSIQTFSTLYNRTNGFSVCLNSSLTDSEKYNIDVQIQYGAVSYAHEFYHIQNDTLTNADFPTNITLYDLDSTSSEEFKINYKDASFLPVGNALIQIQRKYLSEGLFKTVEIPKTDTDGQTVAHLELEDVIYNFIIVKDGVTLATFTDFLVNCNTLLRECSLNLNSVSSHVDIDDFTTLDDFAFTLTYNETSRVISSVFSVPSSTVSTVRLNATMLDTLGTTQVCSKQLISSGGTLTCTVPSNFGNGSVIVQLYKDDVKQGDGVIGLWDDPPDIFGANQVFLLLFLFLTLIGVGISDSPIITVISLLFGIILAIGLNLIRIGGSGGGFVGAGATVLWIIIAIAIVINKGGGRN